MNNFNKKKISIIILIIVLTLFVFLIYVLTNNIRNYREKVLDNYIVLAQLELDKKVIDLYKKVLSKDSSEYKLIQKYVLADDRKELLNLINQIEDYARKNDLISIDSSAVSSVAKRENALITRYKARDLIINLSVSGDMKRIEGFIHLLNNLPLVSYIEKVDVKYDYLTNKNVANITLIIYQKDEIK